MKKSIYPFILIAIPLAIIFAAFYNRSYEELVRRSISIFIIFAVPYCLFVKDPKKGLLVFLAEASMLEGAWKAFTFATNLKMVVYIVRDLLLYATFLNFQLRKKKILPEDILAQKPPYTNLIAFFMVNIIFQMFNPNGYTLLNSITGSRLFWEMIPLYFMGFYLMRDKESFKTLFWISMICVFFNSIATILQYNWGAETVGKITKGYYAMIYEWGRDFKGGTLRPPGLGPDMGFAGFLFYHVVAMFLALFFVESKRDKFKRIVLVLLLILFIVGVAGLLFSLSRTAVVLSALAAVITLYIMRNSISKIIFRLLLSALIAWILVPYAFTKVDIAIKRYQSVRNPIELLRTVFKGERGRYLQAFVYPPILVKFYFFGNGLGRLGPGAYIFNPAPPLTEEPPNSETSLNLSIAELGAIGAFLWVLFHILIVKRSFKILKDIEDIQWRWYAAAAMVSMTVLLTQWQFGHIINFPNNAVFWFMAGTLMAFKYIPEYELDN